MSTWIFERRTGQKSWDSGQFFVVQDCPVCRLPNAKDVFWITVTMKKLSHKFRIHLLGGSATCVENLCLKHFRKTQKPKGPQENLSNPKLVALWCHCLERLERQQEEVYSVFSPKAKIRFCLHLAFISLHCATLRSCGWSFLHPLHSPSV